MFLLHVFSTCIGLSSNSPFYTSYKIFIVLINLIAAFAIISHVYVLRGCQCVGSALISECLYSLSLYVCSAR